jgi:hypothetical protein
MVDIFPDQGRDEPQGSAVAKEAGRRGLIRPAKIKSVVFCPFAKQRPTRSFSATTRRPLCRENLCQAIAKEKAVTPQMTDRFIEAARLSML